MERNSEIWQNGPTATCSTDTCNTELEIAEDKGKKKIASRLGVMNLTWTMPSGKVKDDFIIMAAEQLKASAIENCQHYKLGSDWVKMRHNCHPQNPRRLHVLQQIQIAIKLPKNMGIDDVMKLCDQMFAETTADAFSLGCRAYTPTVSYEYISLL